MPHAGFARTGNTYADTHTRTEHVCGRRESFIKKFPLKSVTAGGPLAARPLEDDRCDSAAGIRLKVLKICVRLRVCVSVCGEVWAN